MKPKFYNALIFILLFLITGIEGQAQFKKVVKSIPPSTNNNFIAEQKRSADNIAKKLQDFIQKNGLTTFQKKSSGNSNSNTNLSNFRISSLSKSSGDQVKELVYDKNSSTPIFIKFSTLLNKTSGALSANELLNNGKAFLNKHRELIKIKNPDSEFELKNQFKDELGFTHFKFLQKYKELEVWGKELVLHIDNYGNVASINGRFVPTPIDISDINEKISETEAVNIGLINSGVTNTEVSPIVKLLTDYEAPVARKIIWCDEYQTPYLAWFIEVRNGLMEDWYYFIDAKSGAILNFYNNVTYDGNATGTGTDLNGISRSFGTYQIGDKYYMIDASQPMFDAANSQLPDKEKGTVITFSLNNKDLNAENPLYYYTSTTNVWTDPAAVSAHYNAITSYKYYKDFLGRNSIDNKGMSIYCIVNVTENNQPMDNAFWTGKVMCYGNGNDAFKPLAGALDVVAHEMTHGVTQYTAALEYQGQSGALNESMSDVFAVMVDDANWTLGELIIKNFTYFPTGAMRDMSNPHNGGTPDSPSWQPANMSEYVNTTQDNGGVHINNSIPNFVFYHAATAIGRNNAANIWYRALTVYLTRTSKFIDGRIATIKAATDLFGDTSNEVNAVKNAWDVVGVTDGTGTPPPPPSSISGENWILMTNTDSNDPNSIYMAKPVISSDNDFYPLSTTKVSNKPAVSDGSGLIIFVDQAHNLRTLQANPNNPSEDILDDSGVWWSVAIGPDLSSLALTSIYSDTTIYYYDLINQQNYAIKIITPSYDAPDAKTALYADALSFDPTGQFLLFDCYNEIKNFDGNVIGFWTINILDLSTGQMGSVFPPMAEGINIGNPSYSKTSSIHFTFDYYDQTAQEDYVMAADFNSGAAGMIAGPLDDIGYPTYSGDDKTIAYHNIGLYQNTIFDMINKMPIKDNMIEGTGNQQEYVVYATYPYWFVIGTRTTDVENEKEAPASFQLEQNYPNPFNPSTVINYQIPVGGDVTLKVYDILGNEVAKLVDEYKPAGRYEVEFNAAQVSRPEIASGVYFYQLRYGEYINTRKMILIK